MPFEAEDRLRDMCEMIIDCPHSTPMWTTDGVIVLRNENIRGGRLKLSNPSYTTESDYLARTRRAVPQPGDIVLTREAPMGEVCKIPEGLKCCLGQRQVLLRPKAGVSPDYLLYALQSPYVQKQIRWNEGTGSTVSNVRIPVIRGLKIPRLGPGESAVAGFLASIDRRGDLNQAINKSLQQLTNALFKAWFVDFLPVRAKATAWAEGRDPLRAAICALSGKDESALDSLPREQYEQLSATAALFPDELADSEVGPLPSGWSVDPLVTHLDVERGLSYQGSGLADVGLPLHNLNSIYEGGGYKFDGIKFYTGKYRDRHLVRSGDVIVANTEQGHNHLLIGYAAVVPSSFGASGLFSQHLYRVRPKIGSDLGPAFVAYLLNSHYMHSVVSGYANGTTVNMLPDTALQHPKFAVPPAPLIQLFEGIAQGSLQSQELRFAESETLAELRDTLLPRLLSGEIRVGEAQELVEAAV